LRSSHIPTFPPSTQLTAPASRLRTENGTPIAKGKIFKKAILIAITLGSVACCCAEACGIDSDGGDGGGNGGGGGGGEVSQMGDAGVMPPMPSYQPQMDYTPISNAAQAPVQ